MDVLSKIGVGGNDEGEAEGEVNEDFGNDNDFEEGDEAKLAELSNALEEVDLDDQVKENMKKRAQNEGDNETPLNTMEVILFLIMF